MARGLILRLDAAVKAGALKAQRFLHWTRGREAGRIMRALAVVAATPGILTALPWYAGVPLLLALLLLAYRQDDQAATEAALAAFLRLILLIVAAGTAFVFLLAPSLIGGTVAVAASLSALGEYLGDDFT